VASHTHSKMPAASNQTVNLIYEDTAPPTSTKVRKP
jgi:hypothetical protein